MLLSDVIDIENISYIENKVGLPSGFIEGMGADSDWGFIIKTHALFESLFSQLLCIGFEKPALESSLLKLPMNGKCSKTSFLSSMELLSKDHCSKVFPFMNELSKLRNMIVHDASNLNFSLQDYYEKLLNRDKKNFVSQLLFYSKKLTSNIATLDDSSSVNDWETIFNSNIRLWLEVTVQKVLEIISLYIQVEELKGKAQ
ncbi:conserved hypothetical protein [Vibrio chagasii]|nr:conserved hypothetical protein [Vibrio chagasii]